MADKAEVVIRKYKQSDHEDVRRIFGSGIKEHVKSGIMLNLQSPKVIGSLTAVFALGCLYSTFLGVALLLIYILLNFLVVYYVYHQYVRYVIKLSII